ncbi:MAG: peptidyl-prolyl cis-trans isomerase, partial [Alphaproteobacteria bacterium]|nr:peptidyl-prolyl cis-trans isomerase [Alphaproteobacteria bacterium]
NSDNRPSDKNLSDKVIASLLDMDEGVESEIIETKEGFIIARVDKITPAHNQEFDSVKQDLVKDWQREAQKKQAYVRANEILVDLNQNGTMPGKKSLSVSRTSGASIDVLNSAFNNPIETNMIVPGSNAFYVMRIKSEKAPQIDSKKMSALRKELEKTNDTLVMDDYNSFLMREYPVRINEKVFNRVLAK